jgi:hypothetical protein
VEHQLVRPPHVAPDHLVPEAGASGREHSIPHGVHAEIVPVHDHALDLDAEPLEEPQGPAALSGLEAHAGLAAWLASRRFANTRMMRA